MAGVYISFPFCSQKCTFCNFASGVFPKSLEAGYTAALEREIARHNWRWTPETVYLGGGTPSSMDGEALARVLNALPGRPWAEATIEAAPGTITREKARHWRELGLTRVSLGVQSFVQTELARTGRRHTAATVEQDVAVLRDSGIGDINLDLIAGLPGQTQASWRESLQSLGWLMPTHVSVYMFELDEDSRLGAEALRQGSRYSASDLPSDEETAAFYETAVEYLHRLGLPRYEISNFAQPGFESRHNLKYWQLEPYVGFGADAHSFDNGRRWQNVETAQEYAAREDSPMLEQTDAVEHEERFFVGLRLSAGIEPRAEEWSRYRDPIQRFLDTGLMATDGKLLWLTPRGVMVSNEVLQEFVDA